MKDFSKYSAIIIGAGDATGGALTKKFASHGYKVCPARRPGSIDKVNKLAEEINSSGGWAKGFGVDARHNRRGSYDQMNMGQQARVPLHGQRIRGASGDTYFHQHHMVSAL